MSEARIVKRSGPMRWWIETDSDGGLGLESGPFWTRTFARLHRWVWL